MSQENPISQSSRAKTMFFCLMILPGVLGVSCAEDTGTPSALPAKANCLVVLFDACHATSMSLYGNPVPTTPFLESIAHESVLFERAYSQATDTLLSVSSILTGVYPRARASDLAFTVSADHPLVSMLFKEAGYLTAVFTSNPQVVAGGSRVRGFEHIRALYPRATSSYDEMATGWIDANANLVQETTEWILSAEDNKPWFCYLHLMKPHNPYMTPRPYLTRFVTAEPPDGQDLVSYVNRIEEKNLGKAFRYHLSPTLRDSFQIPPDELQILRETYAASVNYCDEIAKELYTFLKTNGLLENTLIVFASDHGEAFMEHGRLMHCGDPYEEQIHVPLLMRFPDGLQSQNKTISTPVEMVDLAPTLIDLLDLDKPPEIDGLSLLPLIQGSARQHKDFCLSVGAATARLAVRRDNLKALMTLPTSKEAEPVLLEAYDLATDPGEQKNLLREGSGSLSQEVRELFDAGRRHARSVQQSKAPPPSSANNDGRRKVRTEGVGIPAVGRTDLCDGLLLHITRTYT